MYHRNEYKRVKESMCCDFLSRRILPFPELFHFARLYSQCKTFHSITAETKLQPNNQKSSHRKVVRRGTPMPRDDSDVGLVHGALYNA